MATSANIAFFVEDAELSVYPLSPSTRPLQRQIVSYRSGPEALAIHLSAERLRELHRKTKPSARPATPGSSSGRRSWSSVRRRGSA